MKRFVYIDVLRGIAILTVIIHHLPDAISAPFGRLAVFGGRGVDLFFVLSGFLIGSTALARADIGAPPLSQGKAYWLLRTLRIWPLYFLLLGVYVLGVRGFSPDAAFVLRNHTLPYLTFTSNDLAQGALELGIFWSLAIEEQFYLAIGIIVMTCAKNRQALTAAFVAVAVVAVSVALRMRFELWSLNAEHGLAENWYTFRLYHSTLSRIDQLGLGLISAVVASRLNQSAWARSHRRARTVTWLAIASVVGTLVFFPKFRVVEFLLVGVVFSVGVVISQRPAARFSEPHVLERPVLWFMGAAGRLSFGLYLFHPFTRHWTSLLFAKLGLAMSPMNSPLFLTYWIVQTWVLAALSYRFLEDPLLSWARRKATRILEDSVHEPMAAVSTVASHSTLALQNSCSRK